MNVQEFNYHMHKCVIYLSGGEYVFLPLLLQYLITTISLNFMPRSFFMFTIFRHKFLSFLNVPSKAPFVPPY